MSESTVYYICAPLFLCILLYIIIDHYIKKCYGPKDVYPISEEELLVLEAQTNKVTPIKVGSNSYKVQDSLENPHNAAEIMDTLNLYGKKIIYHLNDTFVNNKTGYNNIKEEYRERVIKGIADLTKNFKTENLIENLPTNFDKDTSYVIDKGDVIAFCLRDVKNNNTLTIDMNELTFVLAHEMTHLFTTTYGHDFEFWSNFRFVLNEVVKMGLHNPINYKQYKKPYCGNDISYSPLYDDQLPDYLIEGNFSKYT